MNTSQQVWIPAGPTLSKPQALALAVPVRAKPERDQYLQLLEIHLQKLVDANKTEARQALEMSQEQAPEMSLIARNNPAQSWGAQILHSDSMQILLNRIDWTQPGTALSKPLPSLQEVLEQLP